MNREILFRGKSLSNGEWVYGFYTQGGFIDPNTGKESVRHIIDNGLLHDIDSDTVGQYTGMRDKHGKKIFEGDVVSRKDSAYGYIDVGIVKYDNSLGAFILEYEHYERKCRCTFAKSFSDNDGKCTIEIKYTFEILGNNFDKQ